MLFGACMCGRVICVLQYVPGVHCSNFSTALSPFHNMSSTGGSTISKTFSNLTCEGKDNVSVYVLLCDLRISKF